MKLTWRTYITYLEQCGGHEDGTLGEVDVLGVVEPLAELNAAPRQRAREPLGAQARPWRTLARDGRRSPGAFEAGAGTASLA